MRTIQQGEKGESVKLLQKRLKIHGIEVDVDGDFGPNTHTAVVQFQSNKRLTADGIVGDKTWDLLMAEPYTFHSVALFEGSKGEDVKKLQLKLTAIGYQLVADGDFGPATKQAVEQFQQAQNITGYVSNDSVSYSVEWGVVDELTWNAIMSTPNKEYTFDDVSLSEAEKDLLVKALQAGAEDNEQVLRVLTVAIGDLGKKEIPNGSNRGPEIDHLVGGYNQYWRIDDVGRPWCAMSVSSWIKIGLSIPGDNALRDSWREHPFGHFMGGCAQILNWGKKHGVFYEASKKIVRPGAAFLMSRSGSGSDPSSSPRAGHIGLVVCDNGDGTFTTIEGNTSNRVKSRKRRISDMIGFVHWWEK